MSARILVTGADGQLGRALVRAAGGRADLVARGRAALDIADRAALERFFAAGPVDAIINAAAYTDVEAAESDHAAARRANAQGPRLLALLCRQAAIPLLHVSTDFVFDGTLGRPYREADATNPLNIYGLSKREGEEAVAAVWDRHIILRVGWAYSLPGRNFVTRMLDRARQGGEVPVVADQFGAPTHHDDIAAALLAMAERVLSPGAAAPYGLYHFAATGSASRAAVAERIFAALREREAGIATVRPVSGTTGATGPTGAAGAAGATGAAGAAGATGARRPGNATLDCGLIGRTFGIIPRPWQERLALTLEQALGRAGEEETAAWANDRPANP